MSDVNRNKNFHLSVCFEDPETVSLVSKGLQWSNSVCGINSLFHYWNTSYVSQSFVSHNWGPFGGKKGVALIPAKKVGSQQ